MDLPGDLTAFVFPTDVVVGFFEFLMLGLEAFKFVPHRVVGCLIQALFPLITGLAGYPDLAAKRFYIGIR
jgi:hypothetical protein